MELAYVLCNKANSLEIDPSVYLNLAFDRGVISGEKGCNSSQTGQELNLVRILFRINYRQNC